MPSRPVPSGLAAFFRPLAVIIGHRPTPVPYSLRLLTPSAAIVPAGRLASKVEPARLTVTAGTDGQWDELLLAHPDGRDIARIERNVVADGSMAAEELDEFADALVDAKPAAGAEWVREYLPRVRAIYAIRVLGGADGAGGWDALGAVRNTLWAHLEGIVQADNEGFSNEDGYHVVWQFSDKVSGPWWMGVLRDGAWVHFEMALGDRAQRAHFLRGEVPPGARLAT